MPNIFIVGIDVISREQKLTWVKTTLQQKGLIPKATMKGRTGKNGPGSLCWHDAPSRCSRHQWVTGKYWDLIVTMMMQQRTLLYVLCRGRSTQSSFRGVKESLSSTDCLHLSTQIEEVTTGIHRRPKASRQWNLTQFGRAMSNWGLR